MISRAWPRQRRRLPACRPRKRGEKPGADRRGAMAPLPSARARRSLLVWPAEIGQHLEHVNDEAAQAAILDREHRRKLTLQLLAFVGTERRCPVRRQAIEEILLADAQR